MTYDVYVVLPDLSIAAELGAMPTLPSEAELDDMVERLESTTGKEVDTELEQLVAISSNGDAYMARGNAQGFAWHLMPVKLATKP